MCQEDNLGDCPLRLGRRRGAAGSFGFNGCAYVQERPAGVDGFLYAITDRGRRVIAGEDLTEHDHRPSCGAAGGSVRSPMLEPDVPTCGTSAPGENGFPSGATPRR